MMRPYALFAAAAVLAASMQSAAADPGQLDHEFVLATPEDVM